MQMTKLHPNWHFYLKSIDANWHDIKMVDIFPQDYIELIQDGVENAPQIEVADWQNWWISKSRNRIIFHIDMPLDEEI